MNERWPFLRLSRGSPFGSELRAFCQRDRGWDRASPPNSAARVKLQPKIVVQASRVVLLDEIPQVLFASRDVSGRRLGRPLKIPPAPVFFESHVSHRSMLEVDSYSRILLRAS